eukprot:Em0001g1880a
MADVIRVQKRRGKYNKYLQSPLIPIPSRTARRHKLSKASDCGKVITKRKLYNTDISSQIPESTARWQNSQPSVSDVLDDDVPDVPDEHEPVNEDSDVDCDVLAHGGTTLIGNHATTTINSDEDSDVLDDNVSDIPDELKPVNEDSDVDWDVLTHGGSSRMGNHATTAVNSDEDRDVESEDDTDIESDESSTSSHFGNCVREANNALQGDDVGMLCDEVPDAEDLRAPTMQECSSDPVSYAAGYSKDCNPCIVNSTSQHLNMKMKENWSTIHNHVYKPAIPGVIADISDGARAKYLASNASLNKLASSFKNERFKSYTGRNMARTSKAKIGNDTSTCS